METVIIPAGSVPAMLTHSDPSVICNTHKHTWNFDSLIDEVHFCWKHIAAHTWSCSHCTSITLCPGFGCHGCKVGGASVSLNSVIGWDGWVVVAGVAARSQLDSTRSKAEYGWSHMTPAYPSLHTHTNAAPSRVQLPWRQGSLAQGSTKNYKGNSREKQIRCTNLDVFFQITKWGSGCRALDESVILHVPYMNFLLSIYGLKYDHNSSMAFKHGWSE